MTNRSSTSYFGQDCFDFLTQLAANNNRQWFDQHKQEYEDTVRLPALDFIVTMADDLAQISPHFNAIPKKVGGSLMRVQRDVRFSKDKRPYKTNIGIQFRHTGGKDVHAPGFYLHIEPENCFVGVGLWRPDATALGKIRSAIAENERRWLSASKDETFSKLFEMSGESLANPPRGYPRDHALINDLKRKDFIGIAPVADQQIMSAKLPANTIKSFRAASPYMRFLCKALELPY